jgi:hypothetical protein
LIGGVLALVAILVAPATAYRVGGSPADLWLASSASFATGAYQVLRLVRYFPLTIALCVLVPALLTSTPMPVRRRQFLLVSVGVALTLPFCYFPSFYAQNGNPPARSLIVPGAMLVGYLTYLGYAAAPLIHNLVAPRRALVAVALALVPVGIAITSLPERALAAEHAARWDAVDQQIRAARDAGQADVTVARQPRYLGEEFVTPDRENWFNVCVARYYDVRSIAASS